MTKAVLVNAIKMHGHGRQILKMCLMNRSLSSSDLFPRPIRGLHYSFSLTQHACSPDPVGSKTVPRTSAGKPQDHASGKIPLRVSSMVETDVPEGVALINLVHLIESAGYLRSCQNSHFPTATDSLTPLLHALIWTVSACFIGSGLCVGCTFIPLYRTCITE